MSTDFRAALLAADARLAEHASSPEVGLRLDARVLGTKAPEARAVGRRRGFGADHRRHYAFAFALVASSLVAALVWIVRVKSDPSPVSTALESVGGLVIVSRSAELEIGGGGDGVVDVRRGACTLRDEARGVTIVVPGSARLRRVAAGIELQLGAATFGVDPRGPDVEPRRILVSHGVIEITGTNFTVEQGMGGGRVTLHEGSIRFVAPHHDPVTLAPGDALEWPPPEPAQAVAKPVDTAGASPPPSASVRAPSAAVPPAPAEDPNDVLARIESLRSQGRYAEAAELASGKRGFSPATRERLSFERGGLLTYQLHDTAAACAHWLAHEQAFPTGRYAVEVARAKAQLGCP